MADYRQYRKDEELARFRRTFGSESYYEDNLRLYRFAQAGSYFANLLSVLTGFAFAFYLALGLAEGLPPAARYAVAGVAASAILVTVEAFKRELVGAYAVAALKSGFRRFKAVPLVLNLALVALSVFLSVKGAERFVHAADDRPTKLAAAFAAKADSLAAHYDGFVAANRERIAEERANKANYFKGAFSYALSRVHAELEKQNGLYAREKADALARLREERSEALASAEAETVTAAGYMVYLATANELACLALIVYVYYFGYRSYVESLPEEKETPEAETKPEPAAPTPPAPTSEVEAPEPPLAQTPAPPVRYEVNYSLAKVEAAPVSGYQEETREYVVRTTDYDHAGQPKAEREVTMRQKRMTFGELAEREETLRRLRADRGLMEDFARWEETSPRKLAFKHYLSMKEVLDLKAAYDEARASGELPPAEG